MRNQQLLEAIEIYFDAIYYCDVKLLDIVFHKESSLFDVDEGSVLVDPIASFRQNVENRPSPASRKQDRAEEIIMIDWLSSMCATVKVRLRAHNNIFVDHLCFVDGEDGWRIVSKVWHLESTID
ncbi:MAG: nuclear transport factor 2 family protein [Kangiellaceae bacterium]|nr:nuclear transport factor 2 family protein [Kangiellaceae bacterium]